MRLGLSNFINARPYVSLSSRYESLITSPKKLREEFFREALDISLLSTEAFFAYPEKLSFLPYGIAALNKTMSVLLFLKKPTDPLLTIAVTTASETSITLLKIILKAFWQRPFRLLASDKPALEPGISGYLLIGDEALFHQSPYPRFDLGTLWHEYTGLPFIFALYAARTPQYNLSSIFSETLDSFFETVEKEEQKEYFTCLQYRLESPHFQGMTLFHDLRQKYTLHD